MTEETTAEEGAEVPALKNYSLKTQQKSVLADLKSLSVNELLDLRDKIDALLPPISIKNFNSEENLLLQYAKIRELQGEIASDNEIPVNQKAQVANSASKLLQDIVRMQSAIYNAEQFKQMEIALAKCLRTLPKEAQEVFFELYGKVSGEMAGA